LVLLVAVEHLTEPENNFAASVPDLLVRPYAFQCHYKLSNSYAFIASLLRTIA
jgi:hypothetical protein